MKSTTRRNNRDRVKEKITVEEGGFMLLKDQGGFVKYYFQIECQVFMRYYNTKAYAKPSGMKRSKHVLGEVDMRTVTQIRPRNPKDFRNFPAGHFMLEIIQGPKHGWLLGVAGFAELTRWVKGCHRSSSLPSLTYEIDVRTHTWFPVDKTSKPVTNAAPHVQTVITVLFHQDPLGFALCAGRGGTVVHHCTENGQADRQGVKPGDLVMQVGERTTTGYSWREVVELLKQAPRPVSMTLGRPRAPGKSANSRGAGASNGKAADNKYGHMDTTPPEPVFSMKNRTKDARGAIMSFAPSSYYSGREAKSDSPSRDLLKDDEVLAESQRDAKVAARRQLSRFRSAHQQLSLAADGDDDRTFNARKTRVIAPNGDAFGFKNGKKPNRAVAASSRLSTIDRNYNKRVRNILTRATEGFSNWLSNVKDGDDSSISASPNNTGDLAAEAVAVAMSRARGRADTQASLRRNKPPPTHRASKSMTNYYKPKSIVVRRGSSSAKLNKVVVPKEETGKQSGGKRIQKLLNGAAQKLKNIVVGGKMVREEFGVEPLVRMLLNGSGSEKEDATEAVLDLAVSSVNQRTLAEAGAIPALVAVLETGSKVAKENAAGALWNLSDTAENESLIEMAGAIPLLVNLLTDGTDIAQEEAAGALWNLADNESSKRKIVAAGGIAPLVRLLSRGTEFTSENAAGALWNLASDPTNWDAIVKENAIKPLVYLLTHGTVVAGENAAGTLMYVTYREDVRKMVADADAIQPLVQLLAFGSEVTRENCAGCIAEIATNNNKYQVEIAQEGAIPALVKLVTEGTEKGKARAAAALRALAQNPSNKVAIAEAGAIPELVNALTSEASKQLTANTVEALWGLAFDNDANRLSIAQHGGIQKLVALLNSKADPKVQGRAAGALGTLAENEKNRASIVQSGAVKSLVGLLGTKNRETKRNAASVLRTISYSNKGQVALNKEVTKNGLMNGQRADIQSIRTKLDEYAR